MGFKQQRTHRNVNIRSRNLCNNDSSTVRKYRHDQPTNEIICNHECNFTPFLYSRTSKYQAFVRRFWYFHLPRTLSYTFGYLGRVAVIFGHLIISKYLSNGASCYVRDSELCLTLTHNTILALTALKKKIALRNLFWLCFSIEMNSNLFKHFCCKL